MQITGNNSHLLYIHVCKVFHVHKIALIFILLLLNSFWPHFSIILCVDIESLFRSEHSIVTLQFEKYWVSALVIAHCKKKLLCPSLTWSLVYRYKYECLDGCWVTLSFRDIVLNQFCLLLPLANIMYLMQSCGLSILSSFFENAKYRNDLRIF